MNTLAKSLHEPDFPTLVAVISHLMTCYALHPCPILASKVAYHLRVLLATHSEDLGPWSGSIEKLYDQWVGLGSPAGLPSWSAKSTNGKKTKYN